MHNQTTLNQVCRLALGVSAAAGFVAGASAQEAENPTAWKTTASIGVTLTRGNSDTFLVSGSVLTGKKWDRNELAFGASVAYGESEDFNEITGEDEDSVNTSMISGFGQYNRLFTDRFFGYARFDALHDDIAALTYRFALSPGVGYYLLKDDRFTLSVEAGPAIVFEDFYDQHTLDPFTGTWQIDTMERSYWTARFGEKFTWKISERARFWQSVDYYPKVDDWADDYYLRAEAGIETDITKKLALRVVAIDDYRSEPAPGREENDFKLIAGLAYKL